ncbi:exonuclease domain-containing protein [Mycobacterium gordonae]|uniref:3'-5' exonuclease n=1 Tax=Mycobacterium gordonae TaxID=1778 RepID=UPI001E366EB2|nr:exonuclease domain-containing protein [Mycobacterium gordonae]
MVDTETTGLNPNSAAILEIAAVNVATGEEVRFVPYVSAEQLAEASPEALHVNRYYERALFREMLLSEATSRAFTDLAVMLQGNTFAGSNPSFDAALVRRYPQPEFVTGCWVHPMGEVWHHRLADLAAYAGPALLLAPNELVGLKQVCDALDVEMDGEHTALGDARATAECFRKLQGYYAHNLDSLPSRVGGAA